ncbi:MAG: hypothetical protein J6N52_14460 [Clostridia bacterium]|nr:hypothetical protein [Clostridia bacterium]
MKKLLILISALMLSFPANIVFAGDFNAVVESREANAGEMVMINISLENNSGLIAALFNLEYDRERLKLIEVTDGQILEGGTFSPNYTSYPYKMVWNSASYENFTDNGVLASLKFEVLSSAKPGDAFIKLSYKNNDVFDVDLNNVALNIKNGAIKVKGSNGTQGGGGGSRPSGGSGSAIAVKPAPDLAEKQIILTIGEKEALVFGETKLNDVAPKIVNDRTMLPARFVAENLGAAVKWDNDARTVTVTKDDITIIITIDSQTSLVNGAAVVLDSPAFIENDRTYTPLRFIAEKLGAAVAWQPETQKVIITK